MVFVTFSTCELLSFNVKGNVLLWHILQMKMIDNARIAMSFGFTEVKSLASIMTHTNESQDTSWRHACFASKWSYAYCQLKRIESSLKLFSHENTKKSMNTIYIGTSNNIYKYHKKLFCRQEFLFFPVLIGITMSLQSHMSTTLPTSRWRWLSYSCQHLKTQHRNTRNLINRFPLLLHVKHS